MKTFFIWPVFLSALACRGGQSAEPPLSGFADMDRQRRADPQEPSKFFADGRTDRPRLEGTVARGELEHPEGERTGRLQDTFVERAPLTVNVRTLARGQDRFDVNCAPCHDRTGSGRGMVVLHGFPPPVDLASERVRGLSDGEIFQTITHGVRNMPPQGKLIAIEDRWAIVTWVRVLQRSQHATLADVPESAHAELLLARGSTETTP